MCGLLHSRHANLEFLSRLNTSVFTSLPLQRGVLRQKKFLKAFSLITLKIYGDMFINDLVNFSSN